MKRLKNHYLLFHYIVNLSKPHIKKHKKNSKNIMNKNPVIFVPNLFLHPYFYQYQSFSLHIYFPSPLIILFPLQWPLHHHHSLSLYSQPFPYHLSISHQPQLIYYNYSIMNYSFYYSLFSIINFQLPYSHIDSQNLQSIINHHIT